MELVLRRILALLAAKSFLQESVTAGAIDTTDGSAKLYLSEDAFPGMHILEREKSGRVFRIYRRGQDPSHGQEPLEVDGTSWRNMEKARHDLEGKLSIPEPEPLQPLWALFDSQGTCLTTLDQLDSVQVAFLIEVGQWMWPAVRIGFVQHALGVHEGAPATLRTLSVRPKIFEVRDFLSEDETDEVMNIGSNQGLINSLGNLNSADAKSGRAHKSFRTSRQAWLSNGLSPLIAQLDARVSNLTRVPASHNEDVQLLRYDETQYYYAHMDWMELEAHYDQKNAWRQAHFGHQDRLATVFWYLNDVAEGGETLFPKFGQPICSPDSRWGEGQARWCPEAPDPDSSVCKEGLRVKPRRGTVIMWYNYHPSGRADRNALHAGCPVGPNLTKWSANKWVRIKPNDSPSPWIEDHPALKRHGFRDSGEVQDDNGCRISVVNHYPVAIKLMWLKPASTEEVLVQTIESGSAQSINSYVGHAFLVKTDNHKSNVVRCRGSGVEFALDDQFRLEESVAQEL